MNLNLVLICGFMTDFDGTIGALLASKDNFFWSWVLRYVFLKKNSFRIICDRFLFSWSCSSKEEIEIFHRAKAVSCMLIVNMRGESDANFDASCGVDESGTLSLAGYGLLNFGVANQHQHFHSRLRWQWQIFTQPHWKYAKECEGNFFAPKLWEDCHRSFVATPCCVCSPAWISTSDSAP